MAALLSSLDPATLAGAAALLGLVVGSFLNVVILRLPVMLERRWRADCRELLAADGAPAPAEQSDFNLIRPGSTCPRCGHAIRPWENIPVLSWLLLRGRCSACHGRIPLRYPLVELASAALAALVAWRLGPHGSTLAALGLTWTLLALAVIDLDRQLLPDALTLPLLWAGLLVNLDGALVPYRDSLLGAVAGYGVLWAVFHGFRLLTGKEGMGHGDFKLLAALGAWLGWQALPLIIVLASTLGALVGGGLILLRRHRQGVPIPFGPFLAAAGWIALLWGPQLTGAYLRYAGLA